eukprot:6489585-Lingulodinium_polyedra.AAC.1
MSEDAFLDAPMPKASVRSRRIDPHLVQAVAQMASEGRLARTTAQAQRWLQRVRPAMKAFSMRSACRSLERRARSYWLAGRNAFDPAK